MMLQQFSAGHAPGVRALLAGAGENVAPQLFGDSARLAVLANALLSLTLGTVPQEQQPPLLLRDVILLRCYHVSITGPRRHVAATLAASSAAAVAFEQALSTAEVPEAAHSVPASSLAAVRHGLHRWGTNAAGHGAAVDAAHRHHAMSLIATTTNHGRAFHGETFGLRGHHATHGCRPARLPAHHGIHPVHPLWLLVVLLMLGLDAIHGLHAHGGRHHAVAGMAVAALHHGCWKSGCPGAGAGAPRTPSTQHWHTIAHDVAAGRLTRRPPTHHVAIGLHAVLAHVRLLRQRLLGMLLVHVVHAALLLGHHPVHGRPLLLDGHHAIHLLLDGHHVARRLLLGLPHAVHDRRVARVCLAGGGAGIAVTTAGPHHALALHRGHAAHVLHAFGLHEWAAAIGRAPSNGCCAIAPTGMGLLTPGVGALHRA
mmetsp:Transcript_8064/g.23949  ORF Transcript_8064/g.23949 Transcript_8064/m.23949 type:complete len:426 (-) Transcript_8064:260-1537(-)